MESRFILFCCLPLILLNAGCTNNSLFVVAPQQQQNAISMASRKAALPCSLSDDQRVKYCTLVPILTAASQTISQKAKDARVDGCAGVEFQLDKDGKAIHLNTVKEFPLDYGFADTLTQKIMIEKYKPSAYVGQWYYVMSTYVTSTMITPKPEKQSP